MGFSLGKSLGISTSRINNTVNSAVQVGTGGMLGYNPSNGLNSGVVGGAWRQINPLLNAGYNAIGAKGPNAAPEMTDSGIPDFTNQYEAAALKLNGEQKQADGQQLAMATAGNQATQRSNLAMRGGLTAGANERLAEAGQDQFANAYGNMATKYGLGASQIGVDAIKTRQEMELQKAMGADRVAALRQNQGGGLLGGKIIPGVL